MEMIQLLEQNLRCGHGATPHPWGPLGQWQTSREDIDSCAGATQSLLASPWWFCAFGLGTSLQRLWCSFMRWLAGWGGTMQWQSCHKEHLMFRVSAPPKPQTPGPSRPVPSGPARSLARVNSRPGDDDGRRIVIWH